MPNKFFVRIVAVVLVVGLFAMTVPTLKSAERKTTGKTNIIQILKQPMLLLSSLLPLSNVITVQASAKSAAGNPAPVVRVRPTIDSPVLRPGTGD